MTYETTESVDVLLARYVAGALPLPARVLVRSHLEIRSDNHGFVADLEGLAGDELDAVTPISLDRRERMLDSIFLSQAPRQPARSPRPSGIFPTALRDFVGFDVEDTPWRTKMPGFREYDLGDVDGCHVSLFWIRPGRRIPSHTHGGSELSLVLDGAFSDIGGRYGRGDISIADETVDHRPVADKDRPCIGLAVTDAPLRLTGSIGQRLSDIIGG